MKLGFAKKEIAILAGLLFLAFVVRLVFFPIPGYRNDTLTYESWFNTAATYGPRVFYSVVSWCDYPPFNVYIFWVFGSLAERLSLFGTSLITYAIKLGPNLFDTATAALIFVFVRKRLDFRLAVAATAVYAFNPAVVFNAAVWGQFDAIYTFFLVASLLLFLDRKPELAAAAFMVGVLTKPQSIALAPLVVFLVFRRFGWRRLLTSVLAGLVTLFAVILPFEWNNPVTFLSNIYFGAYGGYAFTSINAFNVWGFGGMWVPDTQATFLAGWVLFGALAVFVLYFVHRHFNVSKEMLVFFSAFMLFFGFFMLPTRIHERYLFPAMAVLALMVPFLKKMRLIYAVLTGTCLVNQDYVLWFLNTNQFIAADDPVAITGSLINSLVLVYVLALMWRELKGKHWLSQLPKSVRAEGLVGESEHAGKQT
ncbi:MAG: glycosyltransferase 87 family protein [Candidatus Bathyarchaeia archaeon]